MLPNVSTPPGLESIINLLENMTGEDDMQIFTAEPLVDFIDYKWETYAYKVHYTGVIMHIFYMITITAYNLLTYILGTYGEKSSPYFPFLMALGFLYPTCYESYGMWKTGANYLKDPWNWVDIFYTVAGWTNIFFGYSFEAHSLQCVVSMTVVIIFAL